MVLSNPLKMAAVACVLALCPPVWGRPPTHKRRAPMTLTLTSSAFRNGQPLPERNSCEGEDLSPPLSWTGTPAGTKAWALIMEDPDAPAGVWVHWVLYDVSFATTSLKEGLPKNDVFPDGAMQGMSGGVTRFRDVGYSGPCPPPGKPHHYVFKLYALDKKLDLAPGAAKEKVLAAMKGHILAQAELIGLYQR